MRLSPSLTALELVAANISMTRFAKPSYSASFSLSLPGKADIAARICSARCVAIASGALSESKGLGRCLPSRVQKCLLHLVTDDFVIDSFR